MSVFPPRAPQYSERMPGIRKSQLRAGNNTLLIWFVSPRRGIAKRHNNPIVPRKANGRRGTHPPMRAILTSLFLCSAFALGAVRAEPSAEIIAHGKALTEAGDCTSCHTADPQKPFAGGKRIDTPFGAIYSPNLTPDNNTGLGL